GVEGAPPRLCVSLPHCEFWRVTLRSTRPTTVVDKLAGSTRPTGSRSCEGRHDLRGEQFDGAHGVVEADRTEREIADEIVGAGGLGLGRDVILHLRRGAGDRVAMRFERVPFLRQRSPE